MKKTIPFLACIIGIFILSLNSCKTNQLTYFKGADTLSVSVKNSDYGVKLVPSDELLITVSSLIQEASDPYNFSRITTLSTKSKDQIEQPRNQSYIVDAEGSINFPILGKLHVAGLTTIGLTKMLEDLISKDIENPVVRVQLVNFRINVLGEVAKPGAKEVKYERYTIFDALADAGDLTIYGQRQNVLLIRENEGQRSFHRLNLRDADIVNSPYFYLQQNDVIYVEPTKIRSANSEYNQNNSFKISIVSTIVSAISVITSLVIALTR